MSLVQLLDKRAREVRKCQNVGRPYATENGRTYAYASTLLACKWIQSSSLCGGQKEARDGRSVEGKRVLPLIAVMPCRSDAKYTRRGGIPTGYCEIIPLGHRCPMGGMRQDTLYQSKDSLRVLETMSRGLTDFLFISEQLPTPFDLLEIGSLRIGCLFTLLLDLMNLKRLTQVMVPGF